MLEETVKPRLAHDFKPYFVYGGGTGWDQRLIQKCAVCNQLREMSMPGPFLASLPRISGPCLGAFGKYEAGPRCAGKPVVEPQLHLVSA
jgi:hypothetical protein